MAKAKKERKYIKIRGAHEHNLKGIDIDIPRDEFVVLTGLSGSGKTKIAQAFERYGTKRLIPFS